jgi:hypothetical protein
MLQAMSAQLLANDAYKLQRCNLISLSHLMQAHNRFLQDQTQWPLCQAVMQQVLVHLEQLPPNPQQQQQQDLDEQQQRREAWEVQRSANAVAQLAWLLERSQLQSPEYLAALHR